MGGGSNGGQIEGKRLREMLRVEGGKLASVRQKGIGGRGTVGWSEENGRGAGDQMSLGSGR